MSFTTIWDPPGNYLAHFGPYFTDRYATPWGQAINFDGPDSIHVRRFVCDNALMWLRDYHFDGLRIDAVHAIFDTSAVHFLEQLAAEVADLAALTGRHLALIAESDLNDPRVVQFPAIGGYGIHSQWSDDFHHALHTVLTGERDGYYADFGSLADLAKALQRVFVYDGRYSSFRKRPHGRTFAWTAGTFFFGVSAEPRSNRQPRQGRAQQSFDESWTPQNRRGAGHDRAIHSDAFSR